MTPRRPRPHLAPWPAALALALALAAAPAAAAPAVEPLAATVAAAKDRLAATLDLAPAFPQASLRRLGNGLSNVVSVVVAVVPDGGGAPVAVAGRVVEVLFDVWDEDYTVTLREPGLARPVTRRVRDEAGLLKLLSEARGVDLGPLEHLPPGAFRVEARVEVNPVSPELMARTRELLANPGLAGRPGAGTRSVLGAAAGFLLREPAPSDDVTYLRSRPFTRAELGLP